MKPKSFLLLLATIVIFLPVIAMAGEIRGTLKQDGRAVPQATIEIQTSNHTYNAITDNYGSFQVFVPEKGNCTVTVVVAPQHRSSSATVASRDFSVQYNLELKTAGEKLTLTTR